MILGKVCGQIYSTINHPFYDHKRLLVIDKPSGVAVHGGSGISHGVIEMLRHARPDLRELSLVHRLDRETSGCLVLSKRRSALRELHECFRDGRVEKNYLGLAVGDSEDGAFWTAFLRSLRARGLAGVRLVTARGLAATTDAYGRYHVTCATVPNEARGSNFVLKLDDRTLPSGFRVAGDALQVKRATRGKALTFDFGASIHRVVAMDLADAVFEPGSTDIRIQWQPRLNLLLEELQKSPSVLRLSYLADAEDEALVERRMRKVQKQIEGAWQAMNCCYQLTIEPEVFWRLGGPPGKPDVPMQEAR